MESEGTYNNLVYKLGLIYCIYICKDKINRDFVIYFSETGDSFRLVGRGDSNIILTQANMKVHTLFFIMILKKVKMSCNKNILESPAIKSSKLK